MLNSKFLSAQQAVYTNNRFRLGGDKNCQLGDLLRVNCVTSQLKVA